MIDETLQNLRGAKMDAKVMEVMKEGQAAIEELREKATAEDFQTLIE